MSVKVVILLLICIQTFVSNTCGINLVPLEIYEPPQSTSSSSLVKTIGHHNDHHLYHHYHHHLHNVKQQQHQLAAEATNRNYGDSVDNRGEELVHDHSGPLLNLRSGDHRSSRNLQLDSGGAAVADQLQQPRILYQVGVSCYTTFFFLFLIFSTIFVTFYCNNIK